MNSSPSGPASGPISWWSSYLDGANLSFFPPVGSKPDGIQLDGVVIQKLCWAWDPSSPLDASAFLHVAWALVAGIYSGSGDVLFGVRLRSTSPGDGGSAASMVYPLRVRWTPDMTISALIATVEQQTSAMASGDASAVQLEQACPEFQAARGFTCVVNTRRKSQHGGPPDGVGGGNGADVDDKATVPLDMGFELLDAELCITASFSRSLVSQDLLLRVVAVLERCVALMMQNPSQPISALDLVTEADRRQIHRWNARKPTIVRDTAHALFRRQAKRRPDHMALSSWDGQMTYAQLDEASDRLAHRLRAMGVAQETLVPLCFEKSIWAVVAMLGVLKAGGAFAIVEPSQPDERKVLIAEQLGARVAVVARSAQERFPRDCVDNLVTCDESVYDLSLPPSGSLEEAGTPGSAMYVIFTSGSTGVPKGCVTEHWAFCSSMYEFGRDSLMGPDCHSLQFASYSFDTSLEETFCTLFAGATLHIPSEWARMNDLAGEIRRTGTNWAELNPKVLSLLDPDEVPSLQTIILGGDRSHGSDVRRWPASVNLFNSYGCTEASVTSTLVDMRHRRDGDPPIGFGVGCNLWIVHPDDYNKLVPVGAPGELLIEGPGLMRGYLGDAERTARSLVASPAWARAQGPPYDRRFYRTGDIVHYLEDGAVMYQGRKDSQVKVRGQRVELGEIEHQLSRALPDCRVAVEAPSLRSGSKASLAVVAFVVLSPRPNADADTDSKQATVRLDDEGVQELFALRAQAAENLSRSLPSYMLPSLYIPISKIPLTISAKTDRRKLRALAEALTPGEMASLQGTGGAKQQPVSETERQVQAAWATALQVDAVQIGRDDDFLRIGGDSLLAMKAVTALRQGGLQCSVADVVLHPVLRDLAASIAPATQGSGGSAEAVAADAAVAPFSLIPPKDKEGLIREAAAQCAVQPGDIEDLYPCTALQEGLISLSAKQPGSYVMREVMLLAKDIRMADFHRAWEVVSNAHPILRTSIVAVGSTMLQAVVAKQPSWETSIDLSRYLAHDKERAFGFGDALSRYAIIPRYDRFLFVWTAHHCLYDGWTLPLVLQKVAKVYHGAAPEPGAAPEFNVFSRYLLGLDKKATEHFWQSYLDGSPATFPSCPVAEEACPSAVLRDTVDMSPRPVGGITATTALRAAWALLTHSYTGEGDVVFGTTVSGRSAPVPGIEDMLGPTIATVPLRVRLGGDQLARRVADWLRDMQEEMARMVPHEQFGLQNIARVSRSARESCQLGALFVVQPGDEGEDEDGAVARMMQPLDGARDGFDESTTQPLLVECTLDGAHDTVRIRMRYDDRLLEGSLVGAVMQQFKHIASQLSSASLRGRPLHELELVSPYDYERLCRWNKGRVQAVDMTMHDLVAGAAARHGDSQAVHAWDGDMTYAELEAAATEAAGRLRSLGVAGRGEVVLVCFEKSRWAVVSALAILKAGAAFVALDPSQPDERLAIVMQLSRARVLLTCRAGAGAGDLAGRLQRLAKDAPGLSVVCTPDLLASPPTRQQHQLQLQLQLASSSTAAAHSVPGGGAARPGDLAYIIFTSGSTGTPKGVMISHGAAASSIVAHGAAFGVDASSRTMQFASLTFDASIFEIFTTLATGGCVCIPSEAQRLDDLAAALNTMRVNTAMLTPSVLALLEPALLPELRSIIFIAEQVTESDISRWAGHHRRLQNGYGPTECTVVCVTNPDLRHGGVIGSATGCRAWVVREDDANHLVAIGSPGELLVEGPSLAIGYMNDPERTRASFIEDPAWIAKTRPYDPEVAAATRQRRRFYKTGDLVRQMPDGSFVYLGRKDSQVKLRGQRIELGEVDFHVSRSLPEAVVRSDIVHLRPQRAGGELVPTLVTFVVCECFEFDLATGSIAKDLLSHLAKMSAIALPDLMRSVPKYMIPAVFIPIDSVPLTSSGKTDRLRLRALASQIPYKCLELLRGARDKPSGRGPKTPPQGPRQRAMQSAWAAVLQLDEPSIGADDSFFQLGGDSISAMKLVTAARSAGLIISVAQIFKTHVLADLCEGARDVDAVAETAIAPFSLVPAFDTLIHQEAADKCEVPLSAVQDLYPATALQQGLISLSVKEGGSYIARHVFCLRGVNTDRFRRSWEHVTDANAILRTRLVHIEAYGTMQAVMRTGLALEWRTARSVDEYLAEDEERKMDLGTALTRYGLVCPAGSDSDAYFVWTIHHALYDGCSMPLIKEAVATAYNRLFAPRTPPFNGFISYIQHMESAAAEGFWTSYLDGAGASPFPSVSHVPTTEYKADGTDEVAIPWKLQTAEGTTVSTLLRTAYALLIGAYTGSTDVVFGTTLSGRNAPVPMIESMVGPTIVTVPLRLRWDATMTVQDLLERAQGQATEMIPFEQLGLQVVSKLSESARAACQFLSLFVVQPEWGQESAECASLFHEVPHPNAADAPADLTYPLAVEVHVAKEELRLSATFDTRVVDAASLSRILTQLGHIASLLHSEPLALVSELDLTGPHDLSLVREWNAAGLGQSAHVQVSVPDVVGGHANTRPEAAAVSAWDGDLTYAELTTLSGRLATHLRALGVGGGSGPQQDVVALSYPKSKWVPVIMLAILQTGAAFVALDPQHPASRLNSIAEQASIQVLVTSRDLATSSSLGDLPVKKVYPQSVLLEQGEQAQAAPLPPSPLGAPAADAAAYVIFTSGSTGTPKGVVVSHAATISSTLAHGSAMGINRDSRVLQFSSYTFDACVLEIFGALLAGACVCIPSSEECNLDLNMAIQRYSINFAAITPRVASLLQPDRLPGIKAIALGAEVVTSRDIERWGGRRVSNGYGPTECTVVCVVESSNHKPGRIGKAVGCTSWIVNPSDSNRLALVGAPGELLIEGPCLALGYMGDEEKTRASFVQDLPWMKDFPNVSTSPRRCYKTGDIVRYDTDGGLLFMGRKDTQAKLRGQRIELSEVEQHLGELLPRYQVISDVVHLPQEGPDAVALAAFVVPPGVEHQPAGSDQGPLLIGPALQSKPVRQASESWGQVSAAMARRLPSYMVPSLCIPLSAIPLTTSSKRDRKKLQELAESIPADTLRLLRGAEGAHEPPSGGLENKMAMAWAQLLGTDASSISRHDSFFGLGGDSISAMRLIAIAANMGITLRVSDVFKRPVLAELCRHIRPHGEDGLGDMIRTPPTVAAGPPREAEEEAEGLRQKLLGVAASSGCDDAAIVIAPALTHQILAFEFTHLRQRGFINYFSLNFLEPFSYESIRAACRQLVLHHSILRTQLRMAGRRLWQVVLPPARARVAVELLHADAADLDGFATRLIELDTSRRLPSAELENPTRFFVIRSMRSDAVRLVMRLGHSHYDGLAFPMLLHTFTHALRCRRLDSLQPEAPFHAYAKGLERLPRQVSLAYWRQLLKGSRLTPIITPAAATANSGAVSVLTRLVRMPDLSRSGYTFATVLKAAWAIVLAQHSQLTDVTFGCLVSGRMAPVPDSETTVGPALDITPVRAQTGTASTAAFLERIQAQHTESLDHDHVGWHTIMHEATDWPLEQKRTLFAFGSVVQHQNIPLADELNDVLPDLPFEVRARGSTGNAAAVWIITTARPADGLLSIDFEYARDTVGAKTAEALLQALCSAIDHLGRHARSDVPLPDVRVPIAPAHSLTAPSADSPSQPSSATAVIGDDGRDGVCGDAGTTPLLPTTAGGDAEVDKARSAPRNHHHLGPISKTVDGGTSGGGVGAPGRAARELVEQAWATLVARHVVGNGGGGGTHPSSPPPTTTTSMFDIWNSNLVAVALCGIYEELGVHLALDQLLPCPTLREQAALVQSLGQIVDDDFLFL